ncbi:ABC transporter substrate-binding protein [Rhodohalobacter sp. 8-1]|uniref:ABC transporter substrate-binding protein n=1 Tax=Rhodohalobacter sp. 8-1 TaxID=3131972 RepID=UPI0030ECF41A
MNTLNRYYSLFLITTFTFLAACGSGEQVRVVDDSPQNIAQRGPAKADTVETFMQLNVGLIEPVDNMDPLFINNLSSKRVLSLIYDGLFTVDESGSVTQAIARNVTVSDDSLSYTFNINTDIFYHDSDVFISGIGRRVQAADIKWAFERTARATVPDNASELLMNVEGYQDYFEDQRYIYDSERRAIEGVSGIQVVNSQTVRFRLIEPDPNFTKKLASPYLAIYPREALQIQGKTLKTSPVGTGALRFQERNDNTLILIRDESRSNGKRLSSPRLNRIDFTYFPRESQLFQAFAANDLDWIPEIGPETKRVALEGNNSLSPGYNSQYTLHQNGERRVHVYFNDTRRANMAWLKNRLSAVTLDSIATSGDLSIPNPIEAADSAGRGADEQYYVTYTTDPYARMLLTSIQQKYMVPDSEFALTDIRTPISRTAVYTFSNDTYHNKLSPLKSGAWLQMVTSGYGLSHLSVSGIPDTDIAWKLFVENITVNEEQTGTP